MNNVELLVPAGTIEKMKYALSYGADAVYAGVPRFSLRARENDFTMQNMKDAIHFAHRLGKKFYLTMNIFPHNRKVDSFVNVMNDVVGLKPDGLIIADPGMIMLAREKYPELDIHLSTQANTVNWATVKFWHNLGVKRIILSRELSIDEISEIKQRVPEIELEAFVHGAICIAYSGRCLLSNYFNHRDANQGTCTNACRWEYNMYTENPDSQDEGDAYMPIKGSFYLEEKDRPGSLMQIDEDEHGTYIMNAKDLSAIELLDQMIKAGIDSFKVEGRTKSVYYVSTITRAYRKALDHYMRSESVPENILNEVNAVANRGYITGFLEKNPLDRGQNYESGHSGNHTHVFTGIIDQWEEQNEMARIRVRNRFKTGEFLEMITPAETIPFQVKKMTDTNGNLIEIAHGGGTDVYINLPKKPDEYALLRKPVAVSEMVRPD
ncbi:MAG: tRNA 5-hydroxyuridine modification protein YegQ [Calditrichaceae bacterium]